MDFRIDHTHSDQKTVVHVAGRLSGSTVAQLKSACQSIEGPLVIDLTSLVYADNDGIGAIRTIVEKGAAVQGASPFIELLLGNTEFDKRMRDYQGRFLWS